MAQSKEAFFTELARLGSLTDDSEDTDDENFARLLSGSKPVEGKDAVTSISASPSALASNANANAKGIARTFSAPQTSPPTGGPELQPQVPSMKRANTTGTLSEGNKVEGPNRRRRTYTPRTVPGQRQIFKGLGFFFFLNSDVSPLRRLRIQRAQDYGAVWEKSWGEKVTHVIVDDNLVYRDLLAYLSLDDIPPNIAVVDESYPSECIKYGSILNPTQARFRVDGTPSTEVEKPPIETQDNSLPLKPPKKQHTPTPSQPSGDQSDPPVPVEQKERSANCEKPETAGTRERDALDDMIDETKAAKDLPLDPLEPLDAANESEDSDASQSGPEQKKQKGRNDMADSWQQKFACMQKSDENSNSDSPNSRTIEVLQQMLDYYTRTADHWRVLAYRKAISALRRQPKRIITKTQASSIPGIGPRLADKVEEIVFTNRLRRLENANYTPEDHILHEFLGVHGVGIAQASRWVAQGFKTLEDLKIKASLNKAQRIGVKHYEDFTKRIPREEVETHGGIVREAVQAVDPEMQVIIGGSYRRGASDSGDVDLVITKPDATAEEIQAMMMDVVVPRLYQQGFLQASLASTSRADGSKWQGTSVLAGSEVWRRIDLLFVPGAEIGAALIYFTGNDIFNRSMRLLASKKGMRLNQRGLYTDVLRGEQRAKLNPGHLLEGRDERRIFEILGVPWRRPEHRIC